MTFPDDFAAEWRAEERRRKAFLGRPVLAGSFSFACSPELQAHLEERFAAAHAEDLRRRQLLKDLERKFRIAAQAERLSACGPWR